jgi:Tol biopolymer transport system component
MRANGEQSRKVAGEVGDLFRSPVWSADSKQIAFLRGVYRHGEYGVEPQIEILDVASGERKVVMSQVRFGPALAWIWAAIRRARRQDGRRTRMILTSGR